MRRFFRFNYTFIHLCLISLRLTNSRLLPLVLIYWCVRKLHVKANEQMNVFFLVFYPSFRYGCNFILLFDLIVLTVTIFFLFFLMGFPPIILIKKISWPLIDFWKSHFKWLFFNQKKKSGWNENKCSFAIKTNRLSSLQIIIVTA